MIDFDCTHFTCEDIVADCIGQVQIGMVNDALFRDIFNVIVCSLVNGKRVDSKVLAQVAALTTPA